MSDSARLRILTVCIGNVCRSPLAERLIASRARSLTLARPINVSSAGVRALTGSPMEGHAAEQLIALGGDPSGFAARQLTAQHVDGADLVLTASTEVRSQVLLHAPLALRRTFTLRECGKLLSLEGAYTSGQPAAEVIADLVRRRSELLGEDVDVPDPMGRSLESHAWAAQLIEESVASIMTWLRVAG